MQLGRTTVGRKRYWTRARMVEAGARFYREHGVAPTNEDWWHEQTAFTANTVSGYSKDGNKRPFPSAQSLKQYWRGMRAFWEEVSAAHPELNILIEAGDSPWSPLEEWFITESVGLIPRAEVSAMLGRSEPAIKRRLYEMGINSYNRWGWTLNHVERVLGVSAATIKHYLDHGKLPFFQSHKYIFIEPADLFVIEEYNWAKKRHPRELEEAVRKSLMQRLCFILLGFDWRKYSYHKPQPLKKFYTGRVKKARERSKPETPRPRHVRLNDWAIIVGEESKYCGAKRRAGQVKSIVWSPQSRKRTGKTPARVPCWVVTLEFKRTPKHKRTRVNVAADCVKKVAPPPVVERETKPQPPRVARRKKLKAIGARALSSHLRVTPDLHAEGGHA